MEGQWRGTRTVKVALAVQRQTPASMLGQGVQHVVEEADARVDADNLRLARLRGMAFLLGRCQPRVGVGWEVPAIEVQGNLNLGLVGVTSHGRPARAC